MSTLSKNKTSRGFIKATLMILGALVLLKYTFDIDIVEFLTTGRFRSFLDWFYELGQMGWIKYRDILLKIWGSIVYFIKNIF